MMRDGEPINCPNGHGKMSLRLVDKEITFRGVNLVYQAEAYMCNECNISVGTVKQAAAIQNRIADEYRKKVRLLTGAEIRNQRKELGWTQKKLARKAGVGVASIKRWENGVVQTKSMNQALKSAFSGNPVGNPYTGNRATIRIDRVKLVLKEFEKELNCEFLTRGDRLLFDTKYLWYADMIAFHELGKSITGATYAALPYGPQLNNYSELLDEIRAADESSAEPLTEEEKRVIVRVALAFPNKQMAYDASHREQIWISKNYGTLMPYSEAGELTEIEM